MHVNFNLKKENITQIVVELNNDKNYEHLYIESGIKIDKKDKIRNLIDGLENMMIIDNE